MKRGFTLIELLVVVLIIGILAAVALPQYNRAVEKARAAEAMQVLGDLATAEQIYQMTTGNFTDQLDALDLKMPGISGASNLVTKNFVVSIEVAGNSEFTASASRATSAGVVIPQGSQPRYAIRLHIASDGAITRWCADDTTGASGSGSGNEYCKNIANNANGVL